MGLAYFNMHDAQMRIGDTVCLYKGHPYYVQVTGNGNMVRLYKLGTSTAVADVDYTSPDFSYKPFPLGYMNYAGRCYYLMRSPDRRQKQGLSRDLVLFKEGGNPPSGWFSTKSLEDTILGNFPSLAVAEMSIRGGITPKMAFHRTLAVEQLNMGTTQLLFKERPVAHKGIYEDRFKLYPGPDSSFLMRLLPKYGVPL